MNDPDTVDDLIADYLESVETGRPLDRAALLERFPQWAGELTEFFHENDRFDTLMAPLRQAAPRPGPAALPNLSAVGYRLHEEIARGGMGVVYRATHLALGRVVALKMILAGPYSSPEDLRRFRFEAEAVAALDHPHIVPIYEIGEVDGRPFYAMKWIDGRNLAEHLATGPLPPRVAAGLLATVAEAVDYAHGRGILHRDLKPANVLLSAAGGLAASSETDTAKPQAAEEAVPMLADFGLARRLDHASSPTPVGYAVGTPSYLAPELAIGADGRSSASTIASDVYALGAILYECLTGRPPFRNDSPLLTLLDAVQNLAPRPSALNPSVPTDLETVCLKCLDKVPARRYARAADLADDLQRWLRGEPVVARPVGVVGRLWRWCRRQPALATLAGALLLSLVGGLAAFAVQWRRAEANYRDAVSHFQQAQEHQREAERRTSEADEHFQLAHEAVVRFYDRFSEDHLKAYPALQPVRRQLLVAARGYFQQFVARRKNDPALRVELAATLVRIADIDYAIGSQREALMGYQRARALQEQIVAARPDDHAAGANLARIDLQIASLKAVLESSAAALPSYYQAKETLERLLDRQPDDVATLGQLALLHLRLGVHHRSAGDLDRAAGHCESLLQLSKRLLDLRPDNPDGSSLFAEGWLQGGHVFGARARHAEKRCCLARVVALLEPHVQQWPRHTAGQRVLALAYRSIGGDLCLSNAHPEAIEVLRKAETLFTDLSAREPGVIRHRESLATNHRQIGLACLGAARLDEAIAEYQASARILAELSRLNPEVPGYREDLASCHFDIGVVWDRRKKQGEANAAFEQAATIRAPLIERFPDRPGYQWSYGLTMYNLAVCHWQQGSLDQARSAFDRAVKAHRVAFRLAPAVASHRSGLNGCLAAIAEFERLQGRPAAALAVTIERRRLWPGQVAELIAIAREFARITALKQPPTESDREACRSAADEAIATLRSAAAVDRTAVVRAATAEVFAPVKARLRDARLVDR